MGPLTEATLFLQFQEDLTEASDNGMFGHIPFAALAGPEKLHIPKLTQLLELSGKLSLERILGPSGESRKQLLYSERHPLSLINSLEQFNIGRGKVIRGFADLLQYLV